jgi:predicted secreted hydrolase
MNRRLFVGLPSLCFLSAAQAESVQLQFPKDFGAHPDTRTEWWYVTGTLQAAAQIWGFQVTFFRSATQVEAAAGSRFAATQLIAAHAALTDLERGQLRHDQRVARSGFGIAQAQLGNTDVRLRDWYLARSVTFGTNFSASSAYTAHVESASAGFGFDLQLASTQPVLLQGEGGLSKKGPAPPQTSHYYTQPQLAVTGVLTQDGQPIRVQGRAWLDHEWSDSFIDPQAVGWDWIGMNLDDGSALTAFRLRRADDSTLFAGGSWRRVGEAARNFGPSEVQFTPGRVWQSAASTACYPVEWRVTTPVGVFKVRALLDNQELDSRSTTGAIYWEGVSDLLSDSGLRLGRGYLEMTGYAAPLQL